MGGHGNFSDPRLGIEVTHSPDLVSPKLAALRAYQYSLASPPARPEVSMQRAQSVDACCSIERAQAAT
jgi:hypothetical protein